MTDGLVDQIINYFEGGNEFLPLYQKAMDENDLGF
jgi:hypothetical protein